MMSGVMRASRPLSIFFWLITSCVSAGSIEDLESLYQRMASLQNQVLDLRNQYNTEKQNNDRRLVRIEEARSNGNNETANLELQEGYASAERLTKLNDQVNEKEQQIENVCSNWRLLYGPAVDALLENAEKEKNAKKKADIGSKLQKYQSLNSQLCVQAANIGSAEWKTLRVQPYDGPQEINQKVQLLKDISREISIQLTRLDEQHKQSARERRTRDRAQEFIEEGTLFEGGGVNVRTRATSGITTSGEGGPTVNGPGIVDAPTTPEKGNSGDASTTGAPDSSSSTDWHHSSDFSKSEPDYKKQRSELIQQQEELRRKIQEFEAKQRALIQP